MLKDFVRNGEAISGAVLAALGAYIFLHSLALIVGSVRKSGAGRAIDWEATRRALGTWTAFAVAVALMGTLGFVVSFALLTFFVVTFVFRRSLMTGGITA